MNTVNGRGILKHHFHGTYAATIIVLFADKPSATDAAKALGEGWSVGTKDKNCCVFYGSEESLKVAEATLSKFGADIEKMNSCAKSIDYGEEFTVTIPVVPNEQLGLL